SATQTITGTGMTTDGGALWLSGGTLAVPAGAGAQGALGTTGSISAARGAGATLRTTGATATSISNQLDIGSQSAQTFTLGGAQAFTLTGPVVFDTSGSTLAITNTGNVTLD